MSLLDAMPVRIPELPEGFQSTTTSRDVPSHVAEKVPKGQKMNTDSKPHRYGYWECVVKIPKSLVSINGVQLSLDGPFGAIAPLIINPDKPKEIMMKYSDRKGVRYHKINTEDSVSEKEFMIGISITKTKMFRPDKLEVFYNEHQVWTTEIDSTFGFGKCTWKYDMSETNPLDIQFAGAWKTSRPRKEKTSKVDKTKIASVSAAAGVAAGAAAGAASSAATGVKSGASDIKNRAAEKSRLASEKAKEKAEIAKEKANTLTKKINDKSEKNIAAVRTRAQKTKDRADSNAAKAEAKARKFHGDDVQKDALEQKATKASLKAKQVARKANAKAEKAVRKIQRNAETRISKLKDMVEDAKEDAKTSKDDVKKPIEEEKPNENPLAAVGNILSGFLGVGQTDEKNEGDEEVKKEEKRNDQEDKDKDKDKGK